ncbi:hypothetical protein Ccrd_002157 [Cynara cardunculus var. scolymus]|uniref:Uncharacterized protein n=1 Tax=Cynara cardunculus var. scolymus TaxID=59895 RepID=A0A103XRX6_CYNCS|nr:hypothetical protein Ccrd_002157 [Cynara cardunculus var. scolymus]
MNASLSRPMSGSSHPSRFVTISVLLPRSLVAASTLATRFSITLSWHFVATTRGMLVKHAENISEITQDNDSNTCSSLIDSMLLWWVSKIVCAIRYIELAAIKLLGKLSFSSSLAFFHKMGVRETVTNTFQQALNFSLTNVRQRNSNAPSIEQTKKKGIDSGESRVGSPQPAVATIEAEGKGRTEGKSQRADDSTSEVSKTENFSSELESETSEKVNWASDETELNRIIRSCLRKLRRETDLIKGTHMEMGVHQKKPSWLHGPRMHRPVILPLFGGRGFRSSVKPA